MITVQYKDFAEMKAVAREILGLDGTKEPEAVAQAAPAASVMAAPVAPTAPVVPTTPTAPAPVAPAVPTVAAPVATAAPTMATPVTAPVTAPAAVPTTSPEYKIDDLARAAMTLMDAGRQADLQQLLTQFGVDSLPALGQEQYGAFATALRGMGAPI